MTDVKPFQKFFRFDPVEDVSGDVAWTPLVGEVEVGRIYEINQETVTDVLSGHADWKAATKKDYDAQTKSDAEEVGDDEE